VLFCRLNGAGCDNAPRSVVTDLLREFREGDGEGEDAIANDVEERPGTCAGRSGTENTLPNHDRRDFKRRGPTGGAEIGEVLGNHQL